MQDNSEQIFKLLQIIRVNGNIYFLLHNGYSFHSMIKTLDNLRDLNIIIIDGERLHLTKNGEKYFHKLSVALQKRGLYKYLCSDSSHKSILISPDDVYVPRLRRKKRK